jgi:hypothetical protein
VPVADGTRLAVDIFLPKGTAESVRLPTLYRATRYWRGQKNQPIEPLQQQWIARGFAVVNVDVRGTGASFGQWYIPYAPQEARDIGFIAGWIAKQPWSNGRVVMTGNSYPGTTPLMAPAYADGAVKAIAPKFSDFDIYTDLLFPGGAATEALSLEWGRLVRQLDLNRAPDPSSAGVRPVDGPDGEALLAAAIKDHEVNPLGFDQAPYLVTYRDQPLPEYHNMSMDDAGVFRLRHAIEASGVAIFGWGSWLDSGIAQGLLNRFMTLSNPQLTIIGPWTHGAREDVNVFNPKEALDPPATVQEQLIYCFLQHYAATPAPTAAPHAIIYFTMGEDRWKKTDAWPVPGTRVERFYLDAHHELSKKTPSSAGEDAYKVDFEASAGPANRWATQADGPRVDYGDRSSADGKLLVYTSAPLSRDMELTGQPLITLHASSTSTDGNFFVYLEDVASNGRVTYVTEGVLRAIHRDLSSDAAPYKTSYPYRSFSEKNAHPLIPGQIATLTFQLQATSVLLKTGHRIRVAIAGADKGTFLSIPAAPREDVTIHVYHGGSDPSFIDLPIVPADAGR